MTPEGNCEAIPMQTTERDEIIEPTVAPPKAIISLPIGGPDAPTKCNTAGTQSHDSSGCTCKSNCDGTLCDECKYGSFDGPSDKHPNGCLSCWCNDVSSTCEPSNYRYTPLEPSARDSFVLVRPNPETNVLDQLQPAVINQMQSRGNHAEVRGQKDCYWYLPDRFLGNKLRTFGGAISYTSNIDGERRNLLQSDIIIRGNGRTIEYTKIATDSSADYNVKFAEERGWMTNGRESSRHDIMNVLAKIDSILLRACSGRTTYSSFSHLSIDYANGTAIGETATSVEKCQCPTGYRGLSCEECSPGFYRVAGASLGKCEKCQCGGDENECDDFTGLCQVRNHKINKILKVLNCIQRTTSRCESAPMCSARKVNFVWSVFPCLSNYFPSV